MICWESILAIQLKFQCANFSPVSVISTGHQGASCLFTFLQVKHTERFQLASVKENLSPKQFYSPANSFSEWKIKSGTSNTQSFKTIHFPHCSQHWRHWQQRAKGKPCATASPNCPGHPLSPQLLWEQVWKTKGISLPNVFLHSFHSLGF